MGHEIVDVLRKSSCTGRGVSNHLSAYYAALRLQQIAVLDKSNIDKTIRAYGNLYTREIVVSHNAGGINRCASYSYAYVADHDEYARALAAVPFPLDARTKSHRNTLLVESEHASYTLTDAGWAMRALVKREHVWIRPFPIELHNYQLFEQWDGGWLVRDSRDGWTYHTRSLHVRMALHDAIDARRKQREQDAKLKQEYGTVYVDREDSLRSGNCPQGTDQFLLILARGLKAQGPFAVRADVALRVRSDIYVKRAVSAAAGRMA